LSPAVSIDQKTASRNPRSTVATVTEIYDYLRLLFARVGEPHCPNCGRPIVRQSVDQIVDRIMKLGEGARLHILAPLVRGRKGEYRKILKTRARKASPACASTARFIRWTKRTTFAWSATKSTTSKLW
jgi:excinuclease ABC subunit A